MNDVVPYGLIGDKWRELGAESGLLGRALAPEQGTPDPNQASPRIQSFERGVVAWCPDQGPRMMVVGYRIEGNRAMFMWGPTDPFHYDRFIARWHIAPDPNWQQADVEGGPRNHGVFGPLGWPPPGVDFGTSHATVEFIVEGYDDGDARQGWTTPVHLDLF